MGTIRCGGYIFQAFFVTIATILGTGILGLPVKLAKAGLIPFAVVFGVGLIMQISVVWLMTDLLQRTKVRLMAQARARQLASRDEEQPARPAATSIPSTPMSEREDGPLGVAARDAPDGLAVAIVGDAEQPETEVAAAVERASVPDLHALGKLYLDPGSRLVFDASVMLHFVSILVSYGLAGAQSWSKLTGVSSEILISVVIVGYGTIVVVAGEAIKPAIATLTVVKCVVLLVIIGVMGAVAGSVGIVPTDDWSAGLEPFLLGTVALGGVVNIMPVLFTSVPFERGPIRNFRWAVTAGVVVCWVLNILWSAFILGIVPQTREDALHDTAHPELAELGVSLEQAQEEGEISTVPAVAVIEKLQPELTWVSSSVTAFILLSVSVSFTTMGTGLKHVLHGVSRDILAAQESDDAALAAGRQPRPRGCMACAPPCLQTRARSCAGCLRGALPFLWTERGTLVRLCLFWFGLVLLIAQVNPQGFLIVLEVFTSFALNLEAGLLVAVMFYYAAIRRGRGHRHGATSSTEGASLRGFCSDLAVDLCWGWGTEDPMAARDKALEDGAAGHSVSVRHRQTKALLGSAEDVAAGRGSEVAADAAGNRLTGLGGGVDAVGDGVGASPAGGSAAAGSASAAALATGAAPTGSGTAFKAGSAARPAAEAAGAIASSALAPLSEDAIPLALGRGPGAAMTIAILMLFGFALGFDVVDSSLRYLGPLATGWVLLMVLVAAWQLGVRSLLTGEGAAWFASHKAPPAAPPLCSCLCLRAPREDVSFAVRPGHARPEGRAGSGHVRLRLHDNDDDNDERSAGRDDRREQTAAAGTGVRAAGRPAVGCCASASAGVWSVVAAPWARNTVLPVATVAAACVAMALSADKPWASAGAGAARGLVLLHIALRLVGDLVREGCRSMETALVFQVFACAALGPAGAFLFIENFPLAGSCAVLAFCLSLVEWRAQHAVWCMKEAVASHGHRASHSGSRAAAQSYGAIDVALAAEEDSQGWDGQALAPEAGGEEGAETGRSAVDRAAEGGLDESLEVEESGDEEDSDDDGEAGRADDGSGVLASPDEDAGEGVEEDLV
ncbi:hypothetical protein FNF31_03562 [Cafeteria roenbergensis]|uniref:Uncharacterized protein n=3 Tax=Cafeteria roenbergensis TaxID=33653 RepID=A0A5A8D8N5_CAFRO|nr:hypothetical protein FNF31_03562 [Cafeteria roenbergensis]KAA0169641.1 hypothetical protein FNF28_01919 [Cafeteria roenbergensis]